MTVVRTREISPPGSPDVGFRVGPDVVDLEQANGHNEAPAVAAGAEQPAAAVAVSALQPAVPLDVRVGPDVVDLEQANGHNEASAVAAGAEQPADAVAVSAPQPAVPLDVTAVGSGLPVVQPEFLTAAAGDTDVNRLVQVDVTGVGGLPVVQPEFVTELAVSCTLGSVQGLPIPEGRSVWRVEVSLENWSERPPIETCLGTTQEVVVSKDDPVATFNVSFECVHRQFCHLVFTVLLEK